jgi:hypothetical protein
LASRARRDQCVAHGGQTRADLHADVIVVGGVDDAVAIDVAEDGGDGAIDPQPFVANPDEILAVYHAVVVEIARQDVEPAREGGEEVISDRDSNPVGLRDRMSEGDRIARPREGDRDRPVASADRTGDGNISGGERFSFGEGELDARPRTCTSATDSSRYAARPEPDISHAFCAFSRAKTTVGQTRIESPVIV